MPRGLGLGVDLHKGGGASAGGVTASLDFLAGATIDVSVSASATISSATLGVADANRYIVVGVAGKTLTSYMPTSITVGGISATLIANEVEPVGGTAYAAVWIAAVPTGTTGDIVVNYAGVGKQARVTWCRLIHTDGVHVAAVTNSVNSGSTIDLSINTITGGAMYGTAVALNASAGVSWTGATSAEGSINFAANDHANASVDDIVTGETPRTVSAEPVSGLKHMAGVTVSWDFT